MSRNQQIVVFRIDGEEVMIPLRRFFQRKANTPLRGVRAFTAVHNARQAERKD